MENTAQPTIESGKPEVQAPSQPTQPVVPSASQTPPASPPHSRKKLILFGLIGVVIGLAIAGGVFAYMINSKPKTPVVAKITPTSQPTISPTPNPTADWKTYTNKEKGYTIKYPLDRLVRIACPEPEEEFNLEKLTPANAQLDSVPVATCARDARFLFELKTIQKGSEGKPDTEHYDLQTESVQVDGKNASKLTFTANNTPSDGPGGGSWYQIVRIPNGNQVYELYLDNEEFVDVRDQMLKTFKVL